MTDDLSLVRFIFVLSVICAALKLQERGWSEAGLLAVLREILSAAKVAILTSCYSGLPSEHSHREGLRTWRSSQECSGFLCSFSGILRYRLSC